MPETIRGLCGEELKLLLKLGGSVKTMFTTLSQQRFFGFRPQWFDGRKVQITDVEKTIADCEDRPDLCGGVAEAAKGIRIAWQEERLDPQQVVEYAVRMGNRAVIKRFGFIVEQLGLASLEETELWQEALSRGYSPLEPRLPTRGRYDGRWRLQVNHKGILTNSCSAVSSGILASSAWG